MKLYRFSPIETVEDFSKALEYIHEAAHTLCMKALGEYLPVAENIGVFAHYPDEFEFLTQVRQDMTDADVNFTQKYYLLHKELVFPSDAVPAAVYKYLYVRQPDPYRAQVGDVDFVLPRQRFDGLKQQLTENPASNLFARVFPEQRLDMIELHHPDIDVLSYLVPHKMSDSLEKT